MMTIWPLRRMRTSMLPPRARFPRSAQATSGQCEYFFQSQRNKRTGHLLTDVNGAPVDKSCFSLTSANKAASHQRCCNATIRNMS